MHRLSAASMLLALLLGLAAASGAASTDYGPRTASLLLEGRGYRLSAIVLAEPLVEGARSHLYVYYEFRANPDAVASAYLRSPALAGPSSLNPEPSALDHELRIPEDTGIVDVLVRAPPGSMGSLYNVSIQIFLDVTWTNGTAERRALNSSLDLWVLSEEGAVPRPLVVGALSSVLLVVAAPVTAYAEYTGRRRTARLLLAISALLAASLVGSVAPGLGSGCPEEKQAYVLKYVGAYNTSEPGWAGVAYVWRGAGSTHAAFIPPEVGGGYPSWLEGCPQPLCLERGLSRISVGGMSLGPAGRVSYYYHNALRRGTLYGAGLGEAIYDDCGHLLRAVVRRGDRLYYMALNASLGYDPPIASGYYAKLFAAPPLAAATVSIMALRRSGGNGETRRDRG